ncbi:hypothetical protein JAAARDRAFT_554341 [Jaapia argillacea MUCL 33604]|uniref:RNA 3'-terminal phosphate cyclase n=1 Tax=Jaapia argillacea MUCL 33604 TaxID=933084 RepID=A0A067Q0V1_9AGAM|nr:hypothetical protein JAAARDRAFT_554341 [Jaapia argillacea MUCL 33604]
MLQSCMARVLIDGSVLEGGGQILRNSIALSALLRKPLSIHNIRANRTPPGLKNQHAAGLKLVACISSGQLTGAERDSTTVEFDPGPIQVSTGYSADPGTAGSTTLLLQVALPCLLYSSKGTDPSTLILRGGTNASHAPQIDSTQHTLFPFLRRHFGLDPRLEVRQRGYYPKGGGEVIFTMPPIRGPLPPITLTDRGPLKSVKGFAYVARLPHSIARTMQQTAKEALVSSGVDADMINITAVRERDTDAVGAGSGIVLWAETENGCVLGGSAVGMRKTDPAQVALAAADELARNIAHGQCVDEYIQDQIIIFLALASGESKVKTGPLTLHTRTAIWVAEQLTDARFVVDEAPDGQTVTITCQGIGLTAEAVGV